MQKVLIGIYKTLQLTPRLNWIKVGAVLLLEPFPCEIPPVLFQQSISNAGYLIMV